MMKAVDGNIVLKIVPDHDARNPRKEMDGWLGTMVCAHRRYDLGDEQAQNIDNYRSWAAWLIGEVGKPDKDIFALPLYLYDHSGITMNTTGFSCPWDSGQVGWIYVTKEKVRKEFNVKRITKQLREKVLDILREEVKMYDQYLTGDVYGFILEDPDNNVEESCWGFYGSDPKTNGMAEYIDEKYHYLFDSLKWQ